MIIRNGLPVFDSIDHFSVYLFAILLSHIHDDLLDDSAQKQTHLKKLENFKE